jgi:type I restriction enzyme M protein
MTKQELASKIWETANSLRSKIKANEYKDYILGFMFYKYLSDNEERYLNENGSAKEDLKGIDEDSTNLIKDSIGYYISYDELFSTWKSMGIKLGAAEVSEALTNFNRNIKPLYKKVFDNIFSTLQGGLSKLGDSSGSRDKAVRDIVELINDIPTTDNSYDVLGYIYEYMIYKFSTAAKDDGAFYTPHEVSSLIARIVADAMKDKEELKVYDPTSGSGSLLLNIGKESSKHIDKDHIKYYGQEKITETYHLTRMNLVMKGVNVSNIFVRNGDTLSDDWPYFDETTAYEPLFVDVVVSNPPYSLKYESGSLEHDPRFKYGLAPEGKADYAFLLHCLYHLQKDGVMAIVLPHGVLFRGDTEGAIRKNLINNNHIETIIGLPSNLFYATGIPTIIMVLRKERKNDDVLIIDASQNYTKEKSQSSLRECDIKRIFDVVKTRISVENFSKLVEKKDIVKNDYNLNIPRYVSAAPKKDIYDLASVMTGKVLLSELNKFDMFWNRFSSLKYNIVTNDEKDKEYSVFKDVDIRNVLLCDNDVIAFKKCFHALSTTYKTYLIEKLITKIMDTTLFTQDEVIEELFKVFGVEKLVDTYEIYQVISDNWDDINTDLITIRENGIDVCKQIEPNIILKKNSKTKKMEEEQEGFKGTIIPFDLVKETFYYDDFEKMKDLEIQADEQKYMHTYIFESLDDNVKKEVQNKNEDGFDSKALNSAIKTADDDINDDLKNAKSAIESEKKIRKEIKRINEELENKASAKIQSLTYEEINDLLIKKWINPVIDGIIFVVDTTIDNFAKGVISLKKKYANPLSSLNESIHKVDEVLFGLMDELNGSSVDTQALQLLKEALK